MPGFLDRKDPSLLHDLAAPVKAAAVLDLPTCCPNAAGIIGGALAPHSALLRRVRR
jgi:hypothetical protein